MDGKAESGKVHWVSWDLRGDPGQAGWMPKSKGLNVGHQQFATKQCGSKYIGWTWALTTQVKLVRCQNSSLLLPLAKSPSCQMPRQSSAQCFIQLSRHVDGWGRALALHWDKGALDRERGQTCARPESRTSVTVNKQIGGQCLISYPVKMLHVTHQNNSNNKITTTGNSKVYLTSDSHFYQPFTFQQLQRQPMELLLPTSVLICDNMTHTFRFLFCETSV